MLECHVYKDGLARIYDETGSPTDRVLVGVQMGAVEWNEQGRWDYPASALEAYRRIELSLIENFSQANFGAMFCREGRAREADAFVDYTAEELETLRLEEAFLKGAEDKIREVQDRMNRKSSMYIVA